MSGRKGKKKKGKNKKVVPPAPSKAAAAPQPPPSGGEPAPSPKIPVLPKPTKQQAQTRTPLNNSPNILGLMAVGVLCALSMALLFLIVRVVAGWNYLEPERWDDVMVQVCFPFLFGWLGIYLSLDSPRMAGYRWLAIIFCAAVYVGWLAMMIHKDHADQVKAVSVETEKLCTRVDAEERVMDQTQNVFNFDLDRLRQTYGPTVNEDTKSIQIPKGPGPPTPLEFQNFQDAVENTRFGKAYAEIRDNAIQSYLLESQPLQELDSELNRRLGKREGESGDEITSYLVAARGMKRNFLAFAAFSDTAKYLRKLSSRLCPVK
jgi:hypothetical protein